LTDPATCHGDVANICAEGGLGCLELITDDCAVEGLICAGEGVCIPGTGDGTDPGTDVSLAGDDDDSDGSDAAGCAGGPASTGTPFLLLLVLALGALVRRRSLV